MGHVGDAFAGADLVEPPARRTTAIGHTRYSTAGGSFIRNVQPMFADLEAGGVALAHNGNLTNFLTLREQLVARRRHLPVDLRQRGHPPPARPLAARPRLVDRFIDALRQIEGGYALVALTNKKLIGVRDPLGIRPLVLGDLDGKPVLASETCALDIIGARFVRDIEHGEMVVISESGVAARCAPSRRRSCGPACSNTSISPAPTAS